MISMFLTISWPFQSWCSKRSKYVAGYLAQCWQDEAEKSVVYLEVWCSSSMVRLLWALTLWMFIPHGCTMQTHKVNYCQSQEGTLVSIQQHFNIMLVLNMIFHLEHILTLNLWWASKFLSWQIWSAKLIGMMYTHRIKYTCSVFNQNGSIDLESEN